MRVRYSQKSPSVDGQESGDTASDLLSDVLQDLGVVFDAGTPQFSDVGGATTGAADIGLGTPEGPRVVGGGNIPGFDLDPYRVDPAAGLQQTGGGDAFGAGGDVAVGQPLGDRVVGGGNIPGFDLEPYRVNPGSTFAADLWV